MNPEQYAQIVSDLASVRSWNDFEKHSKRQLHLPVIDKILGKPEFFKPTSSLAIPATDTTRVTAWNIERGMALRSIISTLQSHPELASSDVFLLTEVDCGMARSNNAHVGKMICNELNMYGVYVPCYFNLDQGNGAEANLGLGPNSRGLQGHAIVSKYPITNVQAVRLPNTKDHLKGNERQIGNEYAIIASIQHPRGKFDAICLHLAAHSSRKQRAQQMFEVAHIMATRKGPAIAGGDLNTSTYNSNTAFRAILSFWRRVLMGNALTHHYPFPENYFEKKLFQTMEKVGFEIESYNIKGGCTLHYDFNDPFFRMSLGDWLPQWCFHFIDWALKPVGGKCSFKLDWFLGRNLKPSKTLIVGDLPRGKDRFSDHDPIVVDFFVQ